MGDLSYSAIMSLDGYVADEDGAFDWAEPDEEVHRFANDLSRPIGTYLLGRRMYEVLAVWETFGSGADDPEYIRDFAEGWRAADKVVFSTSLEAPSTARTTIQRTFDPDEIRRIGRQRRSRRSRSRVRTWQRRLSGSGWSIGSTCSSPRSSSVAERRSCPPVSRSRCGLRIGERSRTEPCTAATGRPIEIESLGGR